MTIVLLMCLAIALVVAGALIWWAERYRARRTKKAYERLAADRRKACLKALLEAVSDPASVSDSSAIRRPIRARWLTQPAGSVLTRAVQMPVDGPSRLSRFAEQHPVEIAFGLLFLVALCVVLAI